jgi:hypothetical protein
MGVLIRWFIATAAVFGALTAAANRLEAQGVSTPGLTAAFLFNFVKFTTWPADGLREGSPIIICVGGNELVADALVKLTHGKTVEGHSLAIRRTSFEGPLTECQVIYGASLNGIRAEELIRSASGHPILTVSDLEDFAQRGGVANFFIDGGRMRFAVNTAAAERARLRISSTLLALAKVVRDERP